MLNYSTIPLIVVICYVAITMLKATRLPGKWYPLISCALGAAAAAVMYYIFPDFTAASSLAAAVISGGVSGLAATGTNQVFKQLLGKASAGELVVGTEKQDGTHNDDPTAKS